MNNIVAVVAITMLAGCSTLSGGPQPLPNRPEALPPTAAATCLTGATNQSVQAVLAEFECTPISWMSTNTQALKLQRNNVVALRVYLIKKKYNAWERKLRNETSEGNFGTTLALLGLSGLASVVKQGPTSRGLSTAGTIITGAKQGFDRDILFDRTVPILMTQMRASRAKVEEMILKRLNSSYEEWPIGLALADLEALDHAGTVNSALIAVAENVAIAKQVNEDRAEQAIKVVAYDASLTSIALQDYLDAAGGSDETAQTRIDNLLTAATEAGVAGMTKKSIGGFAYGNDPRKQDVLIRLIALESKNPDPAVLAGLAAGLATTKEGK